MLFAGEIRHNHACLPAAAPMTASVMLQKFHGHLPLNWTEWGLNADPSHHPTVHTSALERAESSQLHLTLFPRFPRRAELGQASSAWVRRDPVRRTLRRVALSGSSLVFPEKSACLRKLLPPLRFLRCSLSSSICFFITNGRRPCRMLCVSARVCVCVCMCVHACVCVCC